MYDIFLKWFLNTALYESVHDAAKKKKNHCSVTFAMFAICNFDWLFDWLIRWSFTPYWQYFSHVTVICSCNIMVKWNHLPYQYSCIHVEYCSYELRTSLKSANVWQKLKPCTQIIFAELYIAHYDDLYISLLQVNLITRRPTVQPKLQDPCCLVSSVSASVSF